MKKMINGLTPLETDIMNMSLIAGLLVIVLVAFQAQAEERHPYEIKGFSPTMSESDYVSFSKTLGGYDSQRKTESGSRQFYFASCKITWDEYRNRSTNLGCFEFNDDAVLTIGGAKVESTLLWEEDQKLKVSIDFARLPNNGATAAQATRDRFGKEDVRRRYSDGWLYLWAAGTSYLTLKADDDGDWTRIEIIEDISKQGDAKDF